MRKTDKKIDNQLRDVLTDICETRLKGLSGFRWITHVVNYADFPKSLKIICVFDTNANLNGFMATTGPNELSTLLQKKLFDMTVKLKSSANNISYVTEEINMGPGLSSCAQ
ncbi:MAG: hypothetical protein ACI9W6_002741 [Motiliproteus sp.]|jgi:hypothetical protein